jgi:hypothetical protein
LLVLNDLSQEVAFFKTPVTVRKISLFDAEPFEHATISSYAWN